MASSSERPSSQSCRRRSAPSSASCGGHLPRRRKWSSCRRPPERRGASAGIDRRARLTCKRGSGETDPGRWVTNWRMRGKENAAAQRPWKLLSEPVRADFSAPMGARPPDSVAGVGRPACLCAVLRSSVVDGVQATRNRGRSGGSGRRARERTQQLRAFPAGMKSLDPTLQATAEPLGP